MHHSHSAVPADQNQTYGNFLLKQKPKTLHKIKSAVCRPCKVLISHHKKSEIARKHLLTCHNFQKFVNGLDDVEIPDWYPRKSMKPTEQQQSDIFHIHAMVQNRGIDQWSFLGWESHPRIFTQKLPKTAFFCPKLGGGVQKYVSL